MLHHVLPYLSQYRKIAVGHPRLFEKGREIGLREQCGSASCGLVLTNDALGPIWLLD